jgi:hypothetical protein
VALTRLVNPGAEGLFERVAGPGVQGASHVTLAAFPYGCWAEPDDHGRKETSAEGKQNPQLHAAGWRKRHSTRVVKQWPRRPRIRGLKPLLVLQSRLGD